MSKVKEGLQIIKALGLPKAQHNDRTALCLLALVNLSEDKEWARAESRSIGVTPIMEFVISIYNRPYKPNSRETFRKGSLHQLVAAGLVLINPDDLARPTNSPKNVYQIEPAALSLLKTFGTEIWDQALEAYLSSITTLTAHYAQERAMVQVPVKIDGEREITLSPGDHSLLIKGIIEDFASRFLHGSQLLYVGDTGEKFGFFDEALLASLGITDVNSHGKMPDVILYYPEKNWLILAECVTSVGPVDGKRHNELKKLFKESSAPIVFVTAFLTRQSLARYISVIAWETEVWCADAPTHLIHFNGDRFLGPH